MEKRKVKLFLILCVLFCIVLLGLYIRANSIEKDYQFSGIVQKITYGDKGTPRVVINGKLYFISFPNESFNNEIKQGDSLIKERNAVVYKLVKNTTGEVIISK
jgi:hypothetical protein